MLEQVMNLSPVRLFACRFAEGVSQEHPVNAPDFRLLFWKDLGDLFRRSPPATWRTGPHLLPLLSLPASLLPIAFTGQRLLDAEFLARLQVKGVSLDFPDDVLLQNLPLEAAQRVLQRLALLDLYLSQMAPPTLTGIPICCSAFAARPDFSDGIIRLVPASEPSRLEPAFPSVPCRA